MSKGIDYGMGQTNIDHNSGIRYGVIPLNEVCQAWCDSSEADYGNAHCPKCGNEAISYDETTPDTVDDFEQYRDRGCVDYYCDHCKHTLDSSDCFGDEAIAHTYDAEGYKATQGQDDRDIFILLSPYYTKAEFCSPCAPGACYLLNHDEDGEKCYCFGHDWYENRQAPYPVYNVSDDSLVNP